ncbi:NADP-dependent oxidoreductase [Nakamurella silvestris]|nr:NADP-dependent oxidoreductase [Nakamurella silvestris]
MKAVQFDAFGDADVLGVAEVPAPHAGPGQVRIAVKAASVNPIDWKVRRGYMEQVYPTPLPAVIGSDAAGVVDEVGEGVEGFAVGDEVFGAGSAATAEFAVLDHFAVKPAGLPFAEAAGYPGVTETVVRVFRLLDVKDGQTIVVNGAAGGVGAAAVQFAVARGATVIGTASEGNHEYLRSLGAVPTTYGAGLVDRVRALAPQGVDVALDTAGQGAVADLIELTGVPANVVSIADFAAPKLGARVTTGADERGFESLGQAAALFEDGRFTLPVARTFTFDQAAEAHRESEAGHVRGKLVILNG